MKVSVVIVAKHAERTIRYTVKSLLRQTVKPHEIIVVVDSLTDPTVKAIKNLPVKIVLNDGVGLGSARRKGVELSSGNIIAFIDSDCVADEKWIENLLNVFLFKNNVMVQAGKTIYVKSFYDISGSDADFLENRSSPSFLKFAPTQNLAFRKELINIVGNFDPEFKQGGEDLDFCVRLRKAGYKIYYNPYAKVYHLKHGFNLRIPWRAWRDGRSRAHVFIKHGTAMLSDALISLFHSTSILALISLLVIGSPTLAVLVFMPSLMHRLYKSYINIRQGNTVSTSLLNSFVTYISYISFFISLLTFGLKKLIILKIMKKHS